MNKRILLIIDSLGIGGAEKVTLTLAQGFVNEGFDVDIISCNDIIKFEIPKGVNLHILGFKKSFMDYTRYSKKLHTMIDNLQVKNNSPYDLILVHLQQATRLMKNYLHPKIYHVIHSNLAQSTLKNNKPIKNFFRKRKLQKIYNNLNLITVSNGIKDDLLHTLNIKPKSIQTIYNPVDIDTITILANETNEIIDENTPYIVHVGRFAKVKRHDILIQAYKESNIDAKLLLVGDGEERENIKKLIKNLNLEDKVILAGFQSNPYPFIKNAQMLVLSSEYEGLPTVLIESLALGTPVISTNCKSGPSEIMIDELKNYLVEVNNYYQLAQLIYLVFNKKYEINHNTTEEYSLEKVIKRYGVLTK